MEKEVWYIQRDPEYQNITAVFNLLKPEFERIFGVSIMNNEICWIYNAPNSEWPMLEYGTPLKIRLSLDKLTCWEQLIYQLSHEMTHYAMRQTKNNNKFVLSWFEEILCEAMSLYALKYAADNWSMCSMAQNFPAYGACIEKYLYDIYLRPGTDDLKNCNTIEELRTYEIHKFSESRRESHVHERNEIFGAILSKPEEAKCFLEHINYINPDNMLIIDFKRWYRDNPCTMVEELSKIQPKIKKYEKANV